MSDDKKKEVEEEKEKPDLKTPDQLIPKCGTCNRLVTTCRCTDNNLKK